MFLLQAYAAPGGGDAALSCGVLIQGKYKLIAGYPGWTNQEWNGWPQPPSFSSEMQQTDAPVNNTNCDQAPCLFDIFQDPTEHNDIAAANPDVVKVGELTFNCPSASQSPFIFVCNLGKGVL